VEPTFQKPINPITTPFQIKITRLVLAFKKMYRCKKKNIRVQEESPSKFIALSNPNLLFKPTQKPLSLPHIWAKREGGREENPKVHFKCWRKTFE